MTTQVLDRPRTAQTTHRAHHDVLMRGLYDRHGSALERYVTKLLGGDSHAAADIVQETALRAWRHADRLDVQAADFRPWLLKVAKRLVIDRYRKRQHRPVEVGGTVPEWVARVDDSSERTLSAMVVATALANLSGGHREVIVELYFKSNSVAETALLLGIPAGTVKSRAYYALRALRAAVTESDAI